MTENFATLLEESLADLVMKPGELIMGNVVEANDDYVIVSAGLKSDAEIPASEFKNAAGELTVKVGEESPLVVEVPVRPANFLTVYFVDGELFNDGEAEEPTEQLAQEFLARLPVPHYPKIKAHTPRWSARARAARVRRARVSLPASRSGP